MKKQLSAIQLLLVIIIIIFFTMNLLLINVKDVNIDRYVLFCGDLLILIVAFLTNSMVALLFSAVFVFLLGSYMMYFVVLHDKNFSSYYYIWMGIYPLTAFIAGRLSEYVRHIIEDYIRINDDIENLVTIDSTTGMNNSKQYYHALRERMAQARRHQNIFTLVIVEIQYHEQMQFILGKERATQMIKLLSEILEDCTRIEDQLFRIKPDQFAIILCQTDEEGADVVKTRIKQRMKGIEIDKETYNMEIKIAIGGYNEVYDDPLQYHHQIERLLEYDV